MKIDRLLIPCAALGAGTVLGPLFLALFGQLVANGLSILTKLVLMAYIVMTLYREGIGRVLFRPRPLFAIPLFIFLAYVFLSCTFTPELTAGNILIFFSRILPPVAFIAICCTTQNYRKMFAYITASLMACQVIVILYFLILNPAAIADKEESIIHPNTLGAMCATYFMMSYYFMQHIQSLTKIRRLALHGAQLVLLLGLFLTISKTSILATIVCSFIFLVLIKIPFQIKAMLFGGGAVGVAGFFVLVADKFTEQLKGIETLTGRTDIWDVALYLIQERLTFGYGMNNFYYWSDGLIPFHHYGQTHNEVLMVLFHYGLVGLSMVVILYGLFVLIAAKHIIYDKDSYLPRVALITFIFYMFRGLSEGATVTNFTPEMMLLFATTLFYASREKRQTLASPVTEARAVLRPVYSRRLPPRHLQPSSDLL